MSEKNVINTENLSDPAEQLKAIRKLRETSYSKLSQLDNSIMRFTSRFDQQKDSLTALYEKTQSQQRYLTNVVSTRDALQKTLDLLGTGERLTQIIHKDLASNFDEYIAAMEEVNTSLDLLSELNFEDGRKANENLKSVQKYGEECMVSYFDSIIAQYTDGFPQTYFIFTEDTTEFKVECKELNENITYPILEDDFARMKRLSKILRDIDDTEYINKYVSSRKHFFMSTLKKLFRAARSRPIMSGPLDPLVITNYFRKSHPIHILLFTYNFLVERETAIVRRIFDDNFSIVLDDTINETFDEILSFIEKVRVPTLNQHVDVLFDLDIVQTLQTIIPTFDKHNDASNRPHQEKLSALIAPFNATIKQTFEALNAAIEKHDPTFLPVDGGVSPLTSNILLFLFHLFPYEASVTAITPIERVIQKCIKMLADNIEAKATHYNDSVITQLFIMNNFHFVYTTCMSTPKLRDTVSAENQSRIEDKIQRSQEEYIKLTWDVAFSKLTVEGIGEVKAQTGLTKKQRNMVKMAFKNFRDKIDELRQKHQGYNTKNHKLMSTIMNDTLRKISQKYEKFWSKWKDSGFSKTPEKWICYQPSTLTQMVTKLYSAPAK